MSEQELYEYIEDYIGGRLPQEEQIVFEEKLTNDTQFKAKYDNHLIANELIEIDYAKSLSGLIHKERASLKKAKYFKIGAAILVSMVVFSGLYLVLNKEAVVKLDL